MNLMDLGALVLELLHGRHGRVAGGQHGVDHDHVALAHVFGHLEVVLDGLEGLGVAVQADVADAGAGHHVEHAVQETVAGAQDGDQGQLLAVDDLADHLFHGVSISTSCSGKSRVSS
jgi:hypothetical protein